LKDEKTISRRYEGITQYKLGDNKPLERATHWCASLYEVLNALSFQKKHFEKQGAQIISQRVRKQEITEFYTLGCED
jgi:hypothetical protein